MEQKKSKYIHVQVFSPQGLIYDDFAYSCHVESVIGGMTLLPNHAPILIALAIDAVKVTRKDHRDQDKVDFIAVNGGVLEMRHNRIEIVSNSAINAKDIDEAKVAVEKQRAQEQLEDAKATNDKVAFKRAQISLERAINMLNVSNKR
ncbi:ATP synthase F1 subunit epsilon [Dolosicoccus paucivorans]|uniref:ATP synthase F1 subunit epsilon n=1 Tax=Dolosicoccus paucivorans TaxID=84521 RepID=UPI00088371EC|nr:ATP synthase F1 subunit epsilon [Dolosicoccus paucivorans]SDI77283.1 F-type H+-transporting ATPase subunit epsilon [Dolosicoccus paucivorans]